MLEGDVVRGVRPLGQLEVLPNGIPNGNGLIEDFHLEAGKLPLVLFLT
jgi:hypothetical protein